MTTYIAYLRVSTTKQGHSGLGLEAQQEAVRRFLRPDDVLLETVVEVESGRDCARPQLAAAMAACRSRGSKLLIAKLDRLARDVAFVAALMKSDVKFVACDMPDADPFRLHIEAAIAEEEARKISARTKAAMAVARERGVRFGGFRGRHLSDVERATGRTKANAAKTAAARARATSLMPVIEEIKASGVSGWTAIAAALNERGVATVRGGT
jgi:DNA invertase Pin-like site-specific DNA recombinase